MTLHEKFSILDGSLLLHPHHLIQITDGPSNFLQFLVVKDATIATASEKHV